MNNNSKKENLIKKIKGCLTSRKLRRIILVSFVILNIFIFYGLFFGFRSLIILFKLHFYFSVLWYVLLFAVFILYFALIFKKSKKLCLAYVAAMCLVFYFLFFNTVNIKYNLLEVYDNADYFITNDKIYYIVNYENNIMQKYLNISADNSSINSIDLDGNENNQLCKGLELSTPLHILMLKNNELYFKDSNYDLNKVNLSTCRITKIMDFKYEHIFDPVYNDNYIYLMDSNIEFAKFNLDKMEIETSTVFALHGGLMDLNTLNDYSIGYSADNNRYIHAGGTEIYKFTNEDKNVDLLLIKDNHLFFVIDYVVYRIDLSNYTKVDRIGNIDDSFQYQYAQRYDKYFIEDGKIYVYNEEQNKFENIIDDEFVFLENNIKLYYFGDSLLFEDEINNILLYNIKSKQYREFNSAKHSYDPINEELYIMTKDNKKINTEKIK